MIANFGAYRTNVKDASPGQTGWLCGEQLFSCAPPNAFVEVTRAGKLEFRNDYLRLADLERIKHQRFTWHLMSLELAGVAGESPTGVCLGSPT